MEVKPGYKQTEVGVIPEDWDVKPFGELFAFRNGVNADKESYGRGVRFINVLEPITYSHIHGPEITGQVTLPESVAASYAVRRGDVLFNRTSETQDEVGLAATYLGAERVVFGGFVIRGRPVDETLDPIYSGYALRARFIRSQIIPMGQGAIRANIGQQNLSLVVAPIPPHTEQCAIATALSDVDALLGALDRLIAKKRDLKQAAMQQLLTGQTRLPGFHGEWEVKRLDELASLYQPLTISAQQFTESGFPVYGANGVVGFYHSANHETWQVTVTCRGSTCGTVNRTVERCWITGNAMVLNCDQNKRLSKEFFYHLMLGQDMSDCITGTGQPQIVRSPLAAFRVRIPKDLPEQTAIAEVLSELDVELAVLEQRQAKTRALKQGMMQELLTGKTRLV